MFVGVANMIRKQPLAVVCGKANGDGSACESGYNGGQSVPLFVSITTS